MVKADPLTEQDIEQFQRRGYIKVRAYTVEEAEAMEAAVWCRLESDGVLRNDPTTWGEYPGGVSKSVKKTAALQTSMSEEFMLAVDQLLGEGRWRIPNHCGALMYTFPEARERWDVASDWHWHGDALLNVEELRH